MPELDDLRSPSVVQLASTDLSALDMVPVYHAATNTIRRIPAQDLGGLVTNSTVVAAIEEDPSAVLSSLGQGTPSFQVRNCGLRETLAEVFETNDVRRVLASFKIPKEFAVEGLYRIFVGGSLRVLINGGEAIDTTAIGFVTDPNLPAGATGAVYGFELTGLEDGTYHILDFGDYISLDFQDVGESEDKLVLAGGFDAPQCYVKTNAGTVTSGTLVMGAFGVNLGSPNYIEDPNEDFMLYLVLDIPASGHPPAPLSYLIGWDVTVAGYEYQGL